MYIDNIFFKIDERINLDEQLTPVNSISIKKIKWANNINNCNIKYVLKYLMHELINEALIRRSYIN